MAIDIRLPNINGQTDSEKIKQISSYLFQIAEQLQWALKNVDTSSNMVLVTPTPKSLLPGKQTTATAEETFGLIKSLIIKSADIVNAYYETINEKLVGEYEALSDFGTFKETVTQDITKSATRIDNAFTNIQSIETNLQEVDSSIEEVKTGIDSNLKDITDDIGVLDNALNEAKNGIDSDIQGIKDDIKNLGFALVEVNANIRSGLLYYDENEIPVYGLEIGQKNTVDGVEVFNKFARFTSDRLSFYDQNGAEVAYISDYKLYITNAEVTGTLKLGAFLIDTTKGFTLKWVGRG